MNDIKLPHGTTAWFEMVGSVMRQAASQAGLPSDFNVSLLERYTDAVQTGASADMLQGLRFDIVAGKPFFRVGAQHGERADITITISAAASHRLNTLHSADPQFHAALADFLGNGAMTVDGDLAQLGDWFAAVHDRIVARTA